VTPSEYTVGVFLAEEPNVKPGHKQPQRDRRVFLRAAVYNKDLLFENSPSEGTPRRTALGSVTMDSELARTTIGGSSSGVHDDSVFADVLGSLELAVGRHRTAANHVFINLVGADAEDDLPSVEAAIASFIHTAFNDLKRLKVACVEVRVGTGSVIAMNTSGLRFKITKTLDCAARDVHPLLNKIQRKRMACQNLSSTYVYDIPEIFANVLAEINPGVGDIIDLMELIFDPRTRALVCSDRAPGLNEVGMVCWRVKLATTEYPKGREIILVANDITHMSGSLSPPEDSVYRAAFDLAVAEGLPCVYISSNSGARIGLDEAVKAAFRVKWVDDDDVSKGFKYIYLSEDDYEILSAKGRVKAKRIVYRDEIHYALTDVCGGQSVECLQGSGEIAAATSRAYKHTVTMAYVTGRSVGIGAYCSRLCQRVVQHVDAPLILTGASALNKVLGREVYTSNSQIGGPKVMGANGVSHLTVPDDVHGVKNILQWLSYVPSRRGAPLPCVPCVDPVRRYVTFNPPSSPHDPRELLHSFFDTDSFMEVMPDWGRTVITGRARLGGVPIGAVAVETRTVDKTIPADPAFASAQIAEESQAGQVWFPDSAFKTAQAIGDMNREGLPLIIFANWRGFAGGLRDMYGEVLKYGAYIVDALREYKQPVFVYIPQGGELRGGAWVVIDSSINPEQMEFYAAEGAKGGVLEPEGIVDIKFRRQDLLSTMKRTIPGGIGDSHEDEAKKKALMPTFKQLAVHFAALHDTPGVMLHKKAIKAVIPWETSREFFALRLRARLAEERIKSAIIARGGSSADFPRLLASVSNVIEQVVAEEFGVVVPETHADVEAMLATINRDD
jgi:acetyl-CoA carboxylase carboxyltransferase component